MRRPFACTLTTPEHAVVPPESEAPRVWRGPSVNDMRFHLEEPGHRGDTTLVTVVCERYQWLFAESSWPG